MGPFMEEPTISTISQNDDENRVTKGARTRALIKQQIASLVGQNSPSTVTLQDICRAANVTAGSFYFHFRNKDAALEETAHDAITRHYGALLSVTESDEPLSRQLKKLIEAFLLNYMEHTEQARLIHMIVPSSQNAKQVWDSERGKLVEKLEDLVRRVRHAEARDPHSFFTAEFLLTATESFLDNVFFGTDARLQAAVGAPALIAQNVAAIWERAILNEDPIGDYL